jgi:transcriptional regulator with XRE-family HTH domain
MDSRQQQFGDGVRQLRLEKGWSQEKLAHESGLDRSYLGSVERGERNVSLVNICRIAAAIEVSPSRLMDCVGTDTAGDS